MWWEVMTAPCVSAAQEVGRERRTCRGKVSAEMRESAAGQQ